MEREEYKEGTGEWETREHVEGIVSDQVKQKKREQVRGWEKRYSEEGIRGIDEV